MLIKSFTQLVPRNILIFLLLVFIFRFSIILLFFSEKFEQDFYWEYGEIAKNITNGKGYSLFTLESDTLNFYYRPSIQPSASAYMPPGYVYFILPFFSINDVSTRNFLIIITQLFLSTSSLLLLYHLSAKFFSGKSATITLIIAAFLPEFIFSIVSFTPTILYQFFSLLTLILLMHDSDRIDFKVLLTGFLFVLIIYIRPEFILFAFIMTIYFLFKKQYKKSITIFFILIISMSPWIIRNYVQFDKFIPFTTNFGLNLYRGNNPEEIGSWGNESIYYEISKLKPDNIEVELNKIYLDNSLNYIKNNPFEAIGKSFIKLFQLWIFNYNDKRSFHLFYFIPQVFFVISFIVGFIKSFNYKRLKNIYFFLIYSSLVTMIFFPMPRYQTMMKIVPLIFSGYFVAEILFKKLPLFRND